ncbi:MAG TPA: GNAT family N-acetyltransferase [Candidatus Limnocylindrales bacterium]|nr:GNAT family N-acetyltransferase [Candidatus Limnocylindrales bacterium]
MLLVFGPRSTDYDFGPDHVLTPRRFGPGIDLLRSVGAEPGLAPEPAPDAELRLCHAQEYIEVVRRFSVDPFGPMEAGIGWGDDPPFADMHEASAAVAGGSMRAMEAILDGRVEHAFHPGGGLHHAMRDRASGFCIYNDPALAIARARRDGVRVMYIDLDVHHGDGVQALFWDDPGVLTFSIHESGRYLFPGTGDGDEVGEGVAAGTSVNVPLPPYTGEAAWYSILESFLPVLAAAYGPDLIVSQHGADSHAWDPLAHLHVTTTAHGKAARLVDALVHQHGGGRWLATGGGGYDAYRVVPRTWALTWLAGAHREAPVSTPETWRERWGAEAARYGQAPLPERFDDEPDAGLPYDPTQEASEERASALAAIHRSIVVPRLLQVAIEAGWWAPLAAVAQQPTAGEASGTPTLIAAVDAAMWANLELSPRVIAPADPAAGHALVSAALRAPVPASVSAAVVGSRVVGLAISAPVNPSDGTRELLALGVAPDYRRKGVATALLEAHAVSGSFATVTLAERDPIDPLPREARALIARRLFERAGLETSAADNVVRAIDPSAIKAWKR